MSESFGIGDDDLGDFDVEKDETEGGGDGASEQGGGDVDGPGDQRGQAAPDDVHELDDDRDAPWDS
jgi:hypothetical protein